MDGEQSWLLQSQNLVLGTAMLILVCSVKPEYELTPSRRVVFSLRARHAIQ